MKKKHQVRKIDKTKSTHNWTHPVCKGTMLMIWKESICSTLASEVRAIITTQRSNQMNQLPTDTPSHVKALNKLEREKPWTSHTTQSNGEIELRYRIDVFRFCQRNRKDEPTTIAYALLLSEPQTPLNYHFWRINLFPGWVSESRAASDNE